MKSGNLNFLKPYGPLQVCKGTALPLLDDVRDRFRAPTGLSPAKEPQVHTEEKAAWSSELIWKLCRRDSTFVPVGNGNTVPQTYSLLSSHATDIMEAQ